MTVGPMTQDALTWLLESSSANVRDLSESDFRDWLRARLREHAGDETLGQQRIVREIVARHAAPLAAAAARRDACRREWEARAEFAESQALDQKMHRQRRMVEGLSSAVAEGRADADRLAAATAGLRELLARDAALREGCPERSRFEQAEASLARLRAEVGLTDAEETLRRLKRERGHRSGAVGRRFERTAAEAITKLFLTNLPPSARPRFVLRGVTLGAADTELDFLVVERDAADAADAPVDVVALIEAKRNIDDLASGFRKRQRNLAWLTGDDSIDPDEWRTRSFPAGRFDRPAAHSQDGARWILDRSSFHRFRRDEATGAFMTGLCFVTAPRPPLGVSSVELRRLLHRTSDDARFDVENPADVESLRRRLPELVGPFQTRDVLELYLSRNLSSQIIACDRRSSAGAAPPGLSDGRPLTTQFG